MKTAVMFAGVDALDHEPIRLGVLQIPEVQKRVKQADLILSELSRGKFSLPAFLNSDAKTFNDNLGPRVFACTTVQIGLFDHYINRNPAPDYLMGMSLGDTARTVCSGSVSFEEMLLGAFYFHAALKDVTPGDIVRVRADGPELDEAGIKEIENFGVNVAVHQTPRHFLVAGERELLKRWALEAAPLKQYKVKPLFPMPMHSQLMKPVMDAMISGCAHVQTKPWTYNLVSTVLRKVITTHEELRLDIESNVVGSVYWWQTYKWMNEVLGVEKFVNIGPMPTLMLFAERVPVHGPVQLIDSLSCQASESTASQKSSIIAG